MTPKYLTQSSKGQLWDGFSTSKKNPNDLDPFYKTNLDFWDCFGKERPSSYN